MAYVEMSGEKPTTLSASDDSISPLQIMQWLQPGKPSLVHHSSRTPEAERLRESINRYSGFRIEKGDGWWCAPLTTSTKVVREHNIRRGRGRVVERLCRELPPGAWVLDWAGGTGWLASMLLKRRPDLMAVSVDISDVLQEWGRANYAEPIVYVSGDATSRHIFAPALFDAIVGAECVEHFPNLPAAIDAAHYWLSPRGKLVVTTPNPGFWSPAEPPETIRRWLGRPRSTEYEERGDIYDKSIPSSVLAETMRKAGFRDVLAEYTQFGGEWPLRGICNYFGERPAQLAARTAELFEKVAPRSFGRKLGFTQIFWCKK